MSTETLPRDDTASDTSVAPRESTDSLTGLSTIEGIDLNLEPACEHHSHEERHAPGDPAAYVVRRIHPGCPGATYLLCHSGWLNLSGLSRVGRLHCFACGAFDNINRIVKIVEVLR